MNPQAFDVLMGLLRDSLCAKIVFITPLSVLLDSVLTSFLNIVLNYKCVLL